ncbi:MAG: hypothetical protein ABH804_00160 [archaeon]
MDVIKDIKENIEEGEDALKELGERILEKIEGKGKKVKKTDEDEKKKEPARTNSKSKKEIVKKAEKESVGEKTKKETERKKKEILEKVKKLKEKIDTTSTEELKEQIKIKKRTDMLVPLEEYVKAGIYLGTRVVTPDMRQFVYRRRADGLAIFNTDLIDEKIKEGAEFLSKFNPEDIIVICKRQVGWKVVEMFSKITGIRAFTKKYPAGILTNTALPDFFENELTIITDHWLDKNALQDTLNVNKKVLMICDTNNFSHGADKVIIGNNKSPKSLGVIYYLLTREYCKRRNIKAKIPDLEWWTGEFEEKAKGAKFGV